MPQLDRLPTPEEFAKNTLLQRDRVAATLEEVRATGTPKEVKRYEKLLRDWDKQIRDYGLERYRQDAGTDGSFRPNNSVR